MYHQFMELAGVDITKDAMEVGPTAHYIMGGIRVDAESQETTVPGLFACGEAHPDFTEQTVLVETPVRFDYLWKACW